MIEAAEFDGKDYRSAYLACQALAETAGDMDAAVTIYLERSWWKDAHTARAKRRAKKFIQSSVVKVNSIRRYEVLLTHEGFDPMKVCECESALPWGEVARRVYRRFVGTLRRLELPGYQIQDRAGLGAPIPLEQLQGRAR